MALLIRVARRGTVAVKSPNRAATVTERFCAVEMRELLEKQDMQPHNNILDIS
jgi:hypothetical protein